MKNSKILIALFLLIILVPYPSMLLFSGYADKANYENRTYTSVEDVLNAKISDMPRQAEALINDNAPFRNECISLKSRVDYSLFKTINSDEVILGKENWLFYKNTTDSQAIDDYQGLNQYNQEDIEKLCGVLAEIDKTLKEKNISFKIIVVPNKEQVYSEYMPSGIKVVDSPRIVKVTDYIQNNSEVDLIYPLKELKQISQTEQIFYKYDTHWNNLGALRSLQMMFSGFEKAEVKTEKEGALMDLANISGTYRFLNEDTYYSVELEESAGKEKLYLLHDSFGDMMKPILQSQYEVSDASFAHFNEFELPRGTQVFVIEISERFIYRLFDTAEIILEKAKSL